MLCVLPLRSEAGYDYRSAAEEFLSGIEGLSPALMEKLTVPDIPAVIHDGEIFSLVILEVPEDNDSDVMLELEAAAVTRASMLARRNIAMLVCMNRIDRKTYRYDDALRYALLKHYSGLTVLHGVSTVSEVSALSPRIVLSLARMTAGNAGIVDVPSPSELREDYCEFLYLNHASGLAKSGHYAEALPYFMDILALGRNDDDTLLDASECFAETGHKDECLKILREILSRNPDSSGLSRAAGIFRKAGDRESAAKTFRLAREKYHEENRASSTFSE